ncbi:hypothetical protein [Streptomyces sp. MZ04]|uniref:hypothetical protein n=1 Tax=Streptomyces sp. MZ04 TaxID=2559236 RepID=UPI00107E8618|nr:hypothetical protein [Streptomyces sp. MZ04]TGB16027.1 hypothetical protein E2651_00820 [Streptomyces sp. MZ04]
MRDRALAAYAAGDWAATTSAGHEGTITVTPDGTWSETILGLSGQWELGKNGLTVVMDGLDSEEERDKPYFLPGVPQQAQAALSKTYALEGGWSSDYTGKVAVRTQKDRVTLTFPDHSTGEGADEGLVVTLTKVVQPEHEAP